MSERCPTCGQKVRDYPAGPQTQKIKAALPNMGVGFLTTSDIAKAAGLEVDKATRNAIQYLVRKGKLHRAYPGVFTLTQST